MGILFYDIEQRICFDYFTSFVSNTNTHKDFFKKFSAKTRIENF